MDIREKRPNFGNPVCVALSRHEKGDARLRGPGLGVRGTTGAGEYAVAPGDMAAADRGQRRASVIPDGPRQPGQYDVEAAARL